MRCGASLNLIRWCRFSCLDFFALQFGAQEPGTDAEIKKFAESKGVKMPPFYLMAKTDVNGANQHPLYAKLKEASGSGDLEWNFGKFMVTKGESVKRYPIRTAASDTIPDIEAAQ
jgi:glutathione peroxidase